MDDNLTIVDLWNKYSTMSIPLAVSKIETSANVDMPDNQWTGYANPNFITALFVSTTIRVQRIFFTNLNFQFRLLKWTNLVAIALLSKLCSQLKIKPEVIIGCPIENPPDAPYTLKVILILSAAVKQKHPILDEIAGRCFGLGVSHESVGSVTTTDIVLARSNALSNTVGNFPVAKTSVRDQALKLSHEGEIFVGELTKFSLGLRTKNLKDQYNKASEKLAIQASLDANLQNDVIDLGIADTVKDATSRLKDQNRGTMLQFSTPTEQVLVDLSPKVSMYCNTMDPRVFLLRLLDLKLSDQRINDAIRAQLRQLDIKLQSEAQIYAERHAQDYDQTTIDPRVRLRHIVKEARKILKTEQDLTVSIRHIVQPLTVIGLITEMPPDDLSESNLTSPRSQVSVPDRPPAQSPTPLFPQAMHIESPPANHQGVIGSPPLFNVRNESQPGMTPDERRYNELARELQELQTRIEKQDK